MDCPECFKGKTATGHALEHARNEMLTAACGARPGVPKIVVVITDGHSTESEYKQVVSLSQLCSKCEIDCACYLSYILELRKPSILRSVSFIDIEHV